MVPHQELLVNGFFLGGPCDSSIPKQVVKSPWDGSVVGVAAESMWPQCEAAIDAAKKAALSWARKSRTERAQILQSCANRLREAKDECAELMVKEIGKPISLGRAELDRAALTFELSAALLEEPEWLPVDISTDPRSGAFDVAYRYEALGPVLAITPFNWPFNLAAHKIAPALAAGNTVVLKGSPAASLCTLYLARLLSEAGVPPGVINTVNCEPELAERIAMDERIRMVSFTGSPAVGWHLKERCWDKRVILELGGTASAYVDADTDLASVANELAHAGMAFAGQICISAQNLYINTDVYDAFLNHLVKVVDKLGVGDPANPDTVCGPMISDQAAARVETSISESRGEIVLGGTRDGNRFLPTIIAKPYQEDRIVTEEAFGPILTVQPADVPSLAMVAWNKSPFGIQHSLYTNRSDLVETFIKFVQVGSLVVNAPPTLRFDAMPYGGVKQSGFGREGVRQAFESYSEIKTVVRPRTS